MVVDEIKLMIHGFSANSERAQKVIDALVSLVEKLKFDESKCQVSGPRIDITNVARVAGLRRQVIGSDGCELQECRTLVLDVMELLSAFNLQAECDFLREENSNLKAQLEVERTSKANALVYAWKQRKVEWPDEIGPKVSVRNARAALRIVQPK